ncbi:MAG TPA: sugar phosphate isomerase/epimerase [Thermotogota bacterium]|nr:sugar phosphate isomerase/epimerase [Thermotogota bacterium]
MRISFSTAGLYPIESIEALKLVSQSGFSEAELMPQCYHEITESFAIKARKNLKEMGTPLRVSSIHFPLVFFSTFYNMYPGMRKEAERLSEKVAACASIFGTEVIVVHAPDKPKPGDLSEYSETVIHNIRYLCWVCEEMGITVALENNPKTIADTPPHWREAAALIDCPNLKPMLDTTEASEAGIQPIAFVDETPCAHYHLSDHSGVVKHLLPGEGDQDWPLFFEKNAKNGYRGIYVAEPSYRFVSGNPIENLAKVRRFFDPYLY